MPRVGESARRCGRPCSSSRSAASAPRPPTSGWLEGNAASGRVSEKLGYQETGVSEISPRGTPVPHHDVRIERADWRSPVEVEITGLDGCLALFGVASL